MKGQIEVLIPKPAGWPNAAAQLVVFEEACRGIAEQVQEHFGLTFELPTSAPEFSNDPFDVEQDLMASIFDWVEGQEDEKRLPEDFNRMVSVRERDRDVHVYQDDAEA